ncbi:MAG: serine O-acetyltransferase [Candidatus Margulisbacteria bacterium]|nr:serine O-acetyltransferase [Candidatus Margulisiibacteriota bacterium]
MMNIFLIILFIYYLLILFIAWYFKDIDAVFKGDPAAKNILEVLLYPSIYAVANYRIFHLMFVLKIPFLPRIMSQLVRFFTFIEIHPGAKIGKSFFIDHGDSVVIGETAVIGNNVIIYHQVTLGGTGKDHGKRHPTIKDNVIVGAGAKILGNITIGENCKIGAGSVVLKDVPAYSTVVGNPARVVKVKDGAVHSAFDLGNVPDPLKDEYVKMEKKIRSITKELNDLREEIKKTINK